ncbi:MAG: pitrilysin family protein [Planctomycetota bacterium]
MLNRILLILSGLGLFITINACSKPDLDTHKKPIQLFSKVSHPDKLNFPQLEVKIPKPERIVLGNGLIVYLLEDNELPLMNIKVLIRSGSIYDEDNKSGTANLVAQLLRTGGTTKYPSEILDEKLEYLAAELGTSADYETMQISSSFLSRDFNTCMDILKDILFAPLFPADKLEIEKLQILEAIRRENDRAESIAGREFKRLIYPTHPYGNQIYGNAKSVPLITVSDVKRFYQNYFVPSNMIIGIAGNFKKDNIIPFIKESFGNESTQTTEAKIISPLERKYNKSINLITKDVNQLVIEFGHLGIKRLNPDFFSVILMNAILGGESFVSRLHNEIREQRGLAYGVFSYFTMPKDIGMFIVGTSTKNESVHQVVSLIIQEIKKMQENLVEEAELKNTKEGILNGFVFRFDDSSRVVEQYMFREHFGLPPDYLETYRDNIMKVSREDIRRAAQEYLNPENYILLVVGNSEKFDKPLSEFGQVNEIKLESR